MGLQTQLTSQISNLCSISKFFKKFIIILLLFTVNFITYSATINIEQDLKILSNLDAIKNIVQPYQYNQPNNLEKLSTLLSFYDQSATDSLAQNLNYFIFTAAVLNKNYEGIINKIPKEQIEQFKSKIFSPCSHCKSKGLAICHICLGTGVCKICNGKGEVVRLSTGGENETESCPEKCQSCPKSGTKCKACKGSGGVLKHAVAKKYLVNLQKKLLKLISNFQDEQYKQKYIADFYYHKALWYASQKDDNSMIECLSFSAQNGNENAMFAMGGIFKKINSHQRAYECFKLAAEKGHYEAMLEVIDYLQTKQINSNDHSLTQEYANKILALPTSVPYNLYLCGKYYQIKGDIDKAIQYYSQAADKNNTKAQTQLGYIYIEGKGISKNIAKGLSYLKKVAVNDVEMQKELGLYYLNGIIVKQNNKLAFQYLKDLFLFGKLALDADQKFLPLIKEIADTGNAEANYLMGWYYLYSENIQNPYDEAPNSYNFEINRYSTAADYFLTAYETGYKQAYSHYQKAKGKTRRWKEQAIAYDKLMHPEKYKNGNQSYHGGTTIQPQQRVCADCSGHGYTQYYDHWQQANVKKICLSCKGTGSAGYVADYIDSNGNRQRSVLEQQMGKMMGL
jgi:TPR repeat protein